MNVVVSMAFRLELTRTCACHGVRNVSFSENFAYVPNELSFSVWLLDWKAVVIKVKDWWLNVNVLITIILVQQYIGLCHFITNRNNYCKSVEYQDFLRQTCIYFWSKLLPNKSTFAIKQYWLYVIIMSRTRFRMNLHSNVAWNSRNSLLETGVKSQV